MFRLEDRQLNIIFVILCVATLGLVGFFGIGKNQLHTMPKVFQEMDDFSEGWICNYETTDKEKLLEYWESAGLEETEDEHVIEVVSFPCTVPVKEGTNVSLLRKVPEMKSDVIYLLLQTTGQSVHISIGDELIYESKPEEESFDVTHIVPLEATYQAQYMRITLSGNTGADIELQEMKVGDYGEVITQAFMENGSYVVVGGILVFASILMLLIWFMVDNTKRQKRLLAYGSIEGFLVGLLFLLESQLVAMLVSWYYGIYMMKACVVLLIAIMHLMIMKNFLYKKKIGGLMDLGILVYSIAFVSFVVLQMFGLLRFDTIYMIGLIMFGVGLVLYSILFFVATYDYGHKECKIMLIANGIILISAVIQLIVSLVGQAETSALGYLMLGVSLYFIMVWSLALKRCVSLEKKIEKVRTDENVIRQQIVEQLNPNLLFASFQTLQNLIKNGSDKSVKMIYYISSYIRGNLKAMEQKVEMIPFEEELEHIIAYLQLQKTRNGSLNFLIECKTKEFRVPRHSLEPMVENAVKHGIAPKNQGGNVVIRSYMRKEGYAVQIIDNGVGFDASTLRKGSPTSLLCLLDQLEQTCQAQTEIIAKEGKGTVITIVLPFLDNEIMEDL